MLARPALGTERAMISSKCLETTFPFLASVHVVTSHSNRIREESGNVVRLKQDFG